MNTINVIDLGHVTAETKGQGSGFEATGGQLY